MAPAPKFTIAKPNAAAVSNTAESSVQLNGASTDTIAITRAPSARLKVLIRRLPPGLTQDEFESAIGDEWKLGSGKVDWAQYRPGKVSDDLSKPSKPSRAYLHLTHKNHLNALSDKIRQTSFPDARNTANDPVLLGPPTIEFAPYSRISTGKRRNDARQGTIDQDAEFIQFLESLTNPEAKQPVPDNVVDSVGKNDERIRVTPLIQYLREKRAAKDKPTTLKSKHARQESRNEAREAKAVAKAAAKAAKASPESGSKRSGRSARIERPRELLKAVKKEHAILARKSTDPPAPAKDPESEGSTTPQSPTVKKKPAVTPASAVARMLQRDLGLKGRDRRRKEPNTETADSSQPVKSPAPPVAPQVASPTPAGSTPTAPAILKRADRHASKRATTTTTTPASTLSTQPTTRAPPQPPRPGAKGLASATAAAAAGSPTTSNTAAKPEPTTTQAFLKHANASQGITEALIEAALGVFGTVQRVEIDKRKGFAYVDFASPAALRSAIKASPVAVAQGSVQVLERRDRAPAAGKGAAPGKGAAGAAEGSAAKPTPPARGPVPTGPALRGSGRARAGRGGGSRSGVAASAGATTTTPGNPAPGASPVASAAVAAASITPAASVAPTAATAIGTGAEAG